MNRLDQEKSIIGVYWMGLVSIVNVIIKLLITMILSRLLNSYEFGIFAAVQVVISFAEIFWMMGIGPAIVQKKELTNTDLTTGNTLNIIFGISVYTVVYIFAPFIASFVGINSIAMLRILSIVFIINSVSGISESLIQKEMNFRIIGMINGSSLVVYGISAILFAFLGYGAWALIFAQLIQVLLTATLYIVKRPIEMTFKINKKSAKELMYYGTGFTLSRMFNNLATQGDYLVVNRTLGSSLLGFYNRSYQLLLVPTNVIGTVMDKVLFPLISKYQDNHERIRYVFLNITALMALVAFPITIISLTMGRDLVHVVLGGNWEETIVPFKILITGLFFRMAYKICDSIVRSLGAVYKRLWIQVLYAILIICGAYIGKGWGINGVAVGTSISIFVNYLVMTLLIRHLIRFRFIDLVRYLLPVFIISMMIGSICYLVSLGMAEFAVALARIIIMTLIVVILYLIAYKYIILKTMPNEFIEFVEIIMKTTLKKIKPQENRK